MNYVLFYSNYCKHSCELINNLKDNKIKDDITFICIDNRITIDGCIYTQLENGNKILIPEFIKEVPSMLLLNNNNKTIKGPEILKFINDIIMNEVSNTTNGNMEPECYSFYEMGGLSDPYSYLDISDNELLAKGNGGLRITHDYCILNDSETNINTPPESSNKSDYKLSSIDIDTIQGDREKDIPKMERRI